ncbi:MAG: type II secretion system minor pseudopilin GspK [Burkholderiaceae bacterium]|nr:type II secretion system minor pseudopilin GspK [Burkholderiaceae bacterium]
MRRGQRGAALLAAMLTVTLVATFAASALWQQWRAIELETAERARLQAAWILVGALDWSRLVLREDGRAGDADHLAEPWAVPLQEARLSTFLAAERNVAQQEDASTDTTDAFLSGRIIDLQSRLNLANLVDGNEISASSLRQFRRLFERLGLPVQQLNALAEALRLARSTAAADGQAALAPPTLSQLGWLGLPPATLALLEPHVTLLPVRTPLNLNTAGAEVLAAAIEGLDAAGAQKLVQSRATRHFRQITEARDLLGAGVDINTNEHSVTTSYFEVRGQLRLGPLRMGERSLVRRQGREVTTLWREQGLFERAPATPAAEPLR